MNIKNKNVVLTGASTGIGYDVMELLLEKGAKVVASSRKMSQANLDHPNLYKFDCDVSSAEGVDKLFEYALEKLGNIDIYIANAGFAYYEKMVGADWKHTEKIFNTNVFSSIYAANKLKEISKGKEYNFLITASGMGFISLPGYALYSGTKAALRGFADAYRYELDKGQRLQMVYPIGTRTKFFENAGNIPKPWPLQSSMTVAKSIVKAIEKNKNNTYPSKIFLFFKVFGALCPPAVRAYNAVYNKIFQKWLKENDNN